jgi:integrating conjugative element protein (TIGR03752 family)
MAAIPQNKLTIALTACALAVVAVVFYRANSSGPVKARGGLDAPPVAGSAPAPGLRIGIAKNSADADTPSETLSTVVASTNDLKLQVQKLVDQNQQLQEKNKKLESGRGSIVGEVRDQLKAEMVAEQVARGQASSPPTGVTSTVQSAMADAEDLLGSIKDKTKGVATTAKGIPAGLGYDGLQGSPGGIGGAPTGLEAQRAAAPTYKVIAPVGYESGTSGDGKGALVRKPAGPGAFAALSKVHEREASATTVQAAQEEGPEPYLTIPENSTLVNVTGMTSLVGRVPIDGKVQDPMQFKAIIGRTNLAASGWELPEDLSGIVVTGIAVGDMALSCTEGRIISMTFVFDDGTIRTVSKRKQSSSGGGGGGGGGDVDGRLGHISDVYGNPCIAGKFVTNAPAYLTDIVGAKGLSIGAKAYAAAQTSTNESAMTGVSSTQVTGNRGAYVLGQTAGGAADELVSWLMRRLNNSFDAVVVPSGKKFVLHIEEEIRIDKDRKARRIDHRSANNKPATKGVAVATTTGDHHGMD